jgi:uncharacterized membrane protein YsdA (DUF1294 family)
MTQTLRVADSVLHVLGLIGNLVGAILAVLAFIS